jgi:chorismate synthase
MLRYVTAGESHGKQLTAILEGIPFGLKVSAEDINKELKRRQAGYGRGDRMKLETDKVELLSGVRWGKTIGSPITLAVKNSDYHNNLKLLSELEQYFSEKNFLLRPRPGHADLSGALKFNTYDVRNILERSSARETAARVAAGAVCKKFLSEIGVSVYSFVREIGGIVADTSKAFSKNAFSEIEKSELRTNDKYAEKKMIKIIEQAKKKGDTVGGVFTVVVIGAPAGLGSHAQWDQKLDAAIARSLVSIQAVKGVEFGLGFESAQVWGSEVHDEIFFDKKTGFNRKTNNAGGFEGGMTTGESIIVSCVMKPIPTLMKPLKSVNLKTKKAELAEAVRSDTCAVPAAGVVGEAVVAFELAKAVKEKFGGDSVEEFKRNFNGYMKQLKGY